ncbi:MAG TPA: M20/M25/M40 family metallo-hydrolase [Terriglobales bacterium]|nr:M20/M25/M40 family metallo-hydrolase [Terriglobales bacterium]
MTPLCRRLPASFALILFSFALCPRAVSQTSPPEPQRTPQQRDAYRQAMEAADQKIAEEVKAHSELMKNLEYLTTQIGPRLTGSPQMQAASEWTRKRFQDYGVDAHLETTQIDHGWTRGLETAEITSPIQQRLGIHAFGWSKGTDAEVSGNVIALNVEKMSDFDQYKGKLKGMIVMRNPADLSKLDPNPANAYDAVIPPSQGKAEGGMTYKDRIQLLRLIEAEGPALVILDSGKTDSLYNMGGGFPRYNQTQVPLAFMTHENYSLLYRLLQAGPVTMKFNLKDSFTDKPVPASITVAEIKGSERPDERVIIGGHLDSWDLGQGALDNGTGAMATLEAARTLKALGWKPKRTITFVLFTGEEQGGVGVETFLRQHASEVPKMDAVLVHDTGTRKVFSIALENLSETVPLMQEIYKPLQDVFQLEPLSDRYFSSSDHVAFLEEGVPAYFCVQLPAHYREAHHSQTDTFDKVIPVQINEGAALLAAWAWNVSEMPETLPHHAVTSAAAR